MDETYQKRIADEYRRCADGTIRRITHNQRTYRPFHTALLSEEVIFWSAFERSFSTSFGQRVMEEIARLTALSNGAEVAQRQKETLVEIDEAQAEGIHRHIQQLRSAGGGVPQSCAAVLEELRQIPASGQVRRVRIISDLWWRKDGVDYFVSLKTVKPNIDQTAVAKEDCLHLSLADPTCGAYFGLPYNPYGERREDYDFHPPMGIFDFRRDPAVLIGRDLWDTIGGPGCYDSLIALAQQVGRETKDKIQKMLR